MGNQAAAASIGYTVRELLGPLNELESKHAPERLFAAGETDLVKRGTRVSVIGARQPSPEGWRRARKLAAELAREGVIVVSGLAEGIDTAAHQGALAAGGRTIAVLGTPLDVTYPRQNRELQRRIMAEHLALSPFAPGTPVLRGNFPRRNRVMALISDATVIVEAGDTSGALAQGWEALRLGRLLFILKSITAVPQLTWPPRMLRYGAQVLTDTRSLLSLLPVEAAAGPVAVAF
ncbi:MAG TPA: DNA-processing protein DprA [Thermoanaerobaculia bacterium]|nr:DNA-processing protein DprA [Thermoanaerobaculia bacterium]